VKRDVICPVTLDLILGRLFRRVPDIASVFKVLPMDLQDPAAHSTRFRIPAYMIMPLELARLS
jgi:hypothetical protein